MRLDWENLLNDTGTKFPKTLFFEESTALRFRYGINEQLQYCLFFQFPTEIGNKPVEPVTMANIKLAEETIDGKPALVLTLINEGSRNLFGDLILSLVSQTKDVDDRNIKTAFIRLCNEWFELFDPLAAKLSRPDVQGIFAELYFLKYLLTESPSAINDTLAAWKGPFGKGHDFELGDNLFEIKSIAENNPLVHISSEYQLDYLSGQNLFLIVYAFAMSPAEGLTVGALVQEIARLLRSRTAVNMSLFWAALGKAGLKLNSLPDYDRYIFSIRSRKVYSCLSEDFPSVKRTSLPDAIRNVKYEIALSGITIYEIDDITPFI